MDGWCSVEELTRWGFAHTPVLMANEAHDGLRRCVRTRQVGERMVRAAHEAGVRRLAMEALPWRHGDAPGPFREIPQAQGGYLAQPDMRALMTTALDLGWTLWAYDAVVEARPGDDPARYRTKEFTNWREREQAQNLCRVLAGAAPGEPLLVWTGNSHAATEPAPDWIPMGCHFPVLSGIEPFVIDQTVTVDFGHDPQGAWAPGLLDSLRETLAAHGGTAGILCEHAPESLAGWPADAVIVSTDNALS